MRSRLGILWAVGLALVLGAGAVRATAPEPADPWPELARDIFKGRPLVDVVPGGERQRELAIRFGINLVMYAFTGNYKTDQVHVPALLQRLNK